MFECGTGTSVARPARLTLVCTGTRSRLVVAEVVWGSWGQLNALGSALLVTDACDLGCGAGRDSSYAATVVLDRVETTSAGSQFSRATVLWSDVAPARFADPLQVRLRVRTR